MVRRQAVEAGAQVLVRPGPGLGWLARLVARPVWAVHVIAALRSPAPCQAGAGVRRAHLV